MKNILIILMCLFISSCGVSKKTVKTETVIDRETTAVKQDSSKLTMSKEAVVNSIIEKLDLSRVTITLYNKPDSSGTQSISAVIKQENNIKTTTTSIKNQSQNLRLKTGTKEEVKSDTHITQQITATQKKGGVPFRVYLYGAFIMLLLIGAVWIARKFKKII